MSEDITQSTVYHIPALLQPCIDGLAVSVDGTYVDVTFGGGGHTRAILAVLGERGKVYGFDQDADAEKNILQDARFTFVRGNFCYLKNFLRFYGVEQVDGILADLGVSFHHFDESERGFSFRFGAAAALDMRMNQRGGTTAADILNQYSADDLANIFYLYGELKSSRRLAAAIVAARVTHPIENAEQLLNIVTPFINRKQEKKELAQLFQALRIVVNGEMETLKKMLLQSLEMLRPGGRLVVLTYHSLEDRLVKNFLKTGNFEGVLHKDFFGRIETPFEMVNNKVIIADEEEVQRNPRSRSAKLRIAQKRVVEE